MITRVDVYHQYGGDLGGAPPYHVAHQRHSLPPALGRGGLAGGAVVLTGIPATGGTGYGYLGMDITDPASWPRPFNPQQTAAWFVTPAGAK